MTQLRPGPKKDTHRTQELVRARWHNAARTLIRMRTTEAHYIIGPDHPRWEEAKAVANPYLEQPEDLEIPRFLAPATEETVPTELQALAEPGETTRQTQDRLWKLYLELQSKIMMALASADEIRLHERLHTHMNWLSIADERKL